jgi:23S rRNA (adenine2503-C2)-methyltransferase
LSINSIDVPTGKVCVIDGEFGKLEFVSIGDYGKEANVKADVLGLTRDINGVPNGKVMPLSEKWVVTISSQYGCSMNCLYCSVPLVGPGRNATLNDIRSQLSAAIALNPETKKTKRLNIHYARMGEPTFNENVIFDAWNLRLTVKKAGLECDTIHPVVSTMMPKHNCMLGQFLSDWCDVKNEEFDGNAGLQFSINSTDEEYRRWLFSGNAHSLVAISNMCQMLPSPKGRKYCLNFAITNDTVIDANVLKRYFDSDKFMCKITPVHNTKTSEANGIKTVGGYESFAPYKAHEEALKEAGFDVIVFVPSLDEEMGMITCGNALLSNKGK